MTPRFIVFFVIGGFVAILLGCVTAAVLVIGTDFEAVLAEPTAVPPVVQQFTPAPTFTATSTPQPVTVTPTLTPSPSPLPSSTATPLPTEAPVVEATATPPPLTATQPPQSAAVTIVETPTPAPAGVDFVVARQRMRSNAENSWEEVIANGCGSDHTIYVTVVDAAGRPIDGVLVGDTYDNVRAVSGAAGVGKLEIDLWSNTMALEVKQDISTDQAYTSEQTIPLSAKDEDIPTEWLFEGGYCASMAECELRQNTNGLCRGHYSYDITFQRTW